MIYPEGVAQGAEWPLYNPFGVDELVAFFSQGALTRRWAVLCNAFGVKRWFSTDQAVLCNAFGVKTWFSTEQS